MRYRDMVWPIIRGKSYGGKSGKSMKPWSWQEKLGGLGSVLAHNGTASAAEFQKTLAQGHRWELVTGPLAHLHLFLRYVMMACR